MEATRRGRPKLHPAWIAAAIAWVLLIAAAGVRSTPTMLINPLQQEFGWSKATISAAIGLNIVLFGLVGPFAAALMDRFGIRRVTMTALATLAVAWAFSTLVRTPWELALDWGLLVGVGTGSMGAVLGATIVSRWFETKRGLVMGVLTASNATGQLVFLPLFGLLVAGPGWRACSLLIACVCAALIPLVFFWLRERPADLGMPMYGAKELAPPPPPRANPFGTAFAGLRDGLRSRDFWLLGGSFFICGASTNGLIGTHLVPACGDHGIPEVRAAGLLAMMGIFDLIGTTASGWLTDRYDARWLLCAYYGFRGLSLLFLPHAFGLATFGLPAFAIFYGLDWIATVPPTLKLATKAFGAQRAPLIFGWILAAHQLGAGAVAYLAGVIRTVTLSYDLAFVLSGALCLFAAGIVLLIGTRRADVTVLRTASADVNH